MDPSYNNSFGTQSPVSSGTGDIILQESIPIAADETGGSLHDKLAILGADLLVKALSKLEDGTGTRIVQDDLLATHVKMMDKNLGNIEFSQSAINIERMIRGLNPWPSAYTKLNGKTLKLWRAKVVEYKEGGKLGEVVRVSKDAITVMTGKDALEIHELQLEGKRRLSSDAFLRGYPIEKGTILG